MERGREGRGEEGRKEGGKKEGRREGGTDEKGMGIERRNLCRYSVNSSLLPMAVHCTQTVHVAWSIQLSRYILDHILL